MTGWGPQWGPQGPSPWADPATPTEPGQPYAGPPATAPPYAAPPYAASPAYGQYPAPYGHPAAQWGAAPWVPPRRPQRPGQLVTAAVLAFAQAGVVLLVSLYLWFFASVADVLAENSGSLATPATLDALTTEGTVLAIAGLVSAVALAAAGIGALGSRRPTARLLLVAAFALQVVLAVYWAVRLLDEAGGAGSDGSIVAICLFFSGAPLVGAGMLFTGPGRQWFGGTPPA
ncbi:UNVERIFIED_ORG: hypothetical protein E4P37_05435 [Bacillus sp. AZ43]